MFIRAYLRASTEDQFADRAKEMLEQFVQQRGHKIASYYRENISGTKLDRPELGRLLMDSHHNDILLVEQIDRLTRLSNSDWMTLKKQIEQHELRIVSLDVPTSWQALSDKDPSQADPITRAVITAINNMLIITGVDMTKLAARRAKLEALIDAQVNEASGNAKKVDADIEAQIAAMNTPSTPAEKLLDHMVKKGLVTNAEIVEALEPAKKPSKPRMRRVKKEDLKAELAAS